MGVFNETLKEYGLGSGEKFQGPGRQERHPDPVRTPHGPVRVPGHAKHEIRDVGARYDRSKVKLYYMPGTVLEAISTLEHDEQFGFNGLPMPYDLNISARGAGTRKLSNVLPGKAGPLTPEELEEFKSKNSIDEVVARLLENQSVSEVGQGSPDMSNQKEHEDLPLPSEQPPAPKRSWEEPHKQWSA